MYLWQIEYNLVPILLALLIVVNRFKLCIFDRLNTTHSLCCGGMETLWIALNYVSLTDWIQPRFCIFILFAQLWIALNYVSLTDWIQPHHHLWIVFQYITTKFTIKNLYSILKSELKKFGLFWFYLVLFFTT